jgi:orotidine-5'-phosphate decarboxylase
MSAVNRNLGKKEAAEKIIVALDVAKEEQAYDLVKRLSPPLSFYKVGMRLYAAAGPRIITGLKKMGARVFLDLKFHDIPNTVASTVEVVTGYGIDMFNIHLSGGSAMIRAAVEAAAETAIRLGIPRPLSLGVTVLTSLHEKALKEELEVEKPLEEHVLGLSLLGKKNGLDGVVASSREAGIIRNNCGEKFLIVTPGIRPSWSASDDQQRVLTPRCALESGAGYLVIGRPITMHSSPEKAVEKILLEMTVPPT